MALFSFRKKEPESTLVPPDGPVDSVATLRKRARQRLIGSAVLVVAGGTAFALLFDTQPRAVPIDIPIEIPDKATAKPLAMPEPATTGGATGGTALGATAAVAVAAGVGAAATAAALDPNEKIVPPSPKTPASSAQEAKNGQNTASVQQARPLNATNTVAIRAKPAETPVPTAANIEADKARKAEAAAAAAKAAEIDKAKLASANQMAKQAADAARAKALLEGKPVAKLDPPNPAVVPSADAPRFIVQFGAFADAAKARETRQKVEKAGLKTYAQEATVDGGKRIRVRVGPFATRAEADKAANTIKALGLSAAILTL